MRLAEEKSRQEREMQYIVEQETKKQLDKRRRISSRHTNFAGSYILKGLKAINKDNDMIVSKLAPSHRLAELFWDIIYCKI